MIKFSFNLLIVLFVAFWYPVIGNTSEKSSWPVFMSAIEAGAVTYCKSVTLWGVLVEVYGAAPSIFTVRPESGIVRARSSMSGAGMETTWEGLGKIPSGTETFLWSFSEPFYYGDLNGSFDAVVLEPGYAYFFYATEIFGATSQLVINIYRIGACSIEFRQMKGQNFPLVFSDYIKKAKPGIFKEFKSIIIGESPAPE